MGKMKAKSAQKTLPNPGDVFLMPLGDGRFGVCRVLRTNTEAERKFHGDPRVLVACSQWIGTETPDLGDAQLRQIQKLTHHSWKNGLNMCWVSEPPPDAFRRIGVIEPSASEKRRKWDASSGWNFPLGLLMQWRWDHEREAVLREDAEKLEQQAREREQASRRLQEVAPPTLRTLRTKRRFFGWKGFAPDKAASACRAIFRQSIDAIISLGEKPSKAATLRVLQKCIERLNELDTQYEQFIETTIREELCEEFDEVVQASGLKNYENLADRWRDW